MRKFAYIILLTGFSLVLMNLAFTNSLATDGENLAKLSYQKDKINQDMELSKQEIMEAQSSENVQKMANDLGFIDRFADGSDK